MEKTEKRQIIEEFLKFAKEVYNLELCNYEQWEEYAFFPIGEEVQKVIHHFIKGE